MYEWVEKARETISDLVLTPDGRIIKEDQEDIKRMYEEYLKESYTIVSF